MKVGEDSVLLGVWTPLTGAERRVLDIGAGTGLLSLMLAQRTAAAEITAVEIDVQASEQATENCRNSCWNDRLTVVNCDIKQYGAPESFDLIISNPPYFERSLKSPDAGKNLARHDDALSLDTLVDCVARLLSPEGRFALILPVERAATLLDLARHSGLYPRQQLNVRPKASKTVNRVVLELCRNVASTTVHELVLRTETGAYTEVYKQLTAAFYL
jgi:tRNA1Val (adenine37-N6)-methyltransferase